MTSLAILVGGVVAIVLVFWGLKIWSRRRAAKAEAEAAEGKGKASWSAKFASETEVKEATRQDAARASVVKQAAHLARDCDCGLYKRLWGFAEGGLIQWEVYQGETEVLGILVRFEELERVFSSASDFYYETLEEMLCAAAAPHYWRAVEGQGEVFEEVDSGLLTRRPANLSRSSRKPRPKAGSGDQIDQTQERTRRRRFLSCLAHPIALNHRGSPRPPQALSSLAQPRLGYMDRWGTPSVPAV